MFGYVKTDLPNMYVKDTQLYKAMYCGLCKGIGKSCGQKGRLLLNYDLAFLSVFLHNLLGIDVKIEKQKCVIHQLKKRPIAVVDSLTERIGALNVILAYHKLGDDVIDSGKGRASRSFFKSSYKRAKVKEPVLDQIVRKRYEELVQYEKTNGDSIDVSADPFANMMKEICEVLLASEYTEEIGNLCYNLGKWVYLIDALDDFDKDKKNGEFNVFVNSYPDKISKNQLLDDNRPEIVCVFTGILSAVAEQAKGLKYKFNHDLIDNVLLRGLSVQTKQIMENEKCKNFTKS